MKVIAATALVLLVIQPLPPPFPREGVTKVVENEYAIVWNAHFPRNQKTAMHEHTMDLAAIFLTGGQVNTIMQDGEVRIGKPFDGGRVLFQPKGTIHREEYVSEGTWAIGVELKARKATAPARSTGPDPVTVEPQTFVTLLDNDQVRIVETIVRPGQSFARHSHPGRVVVQPVGCSDQVPPASALTTPDGLRVWWAAAEVHPAGAAKVTAECRYKEVEIKAAR